MNPEFKTEMRNDIAATLAQLRAWLEEHQPLTFVLHVLAEDGASCSASLVHPTALAVTIGTLEMVKLSLASELSAYIRSIGTGPPTSQ